MTVSTSSSSVTLQGTGSLTSFGFNFIGVSASDIEVIYTDANGAQTTLLTSQYTLTLNAVAPGALWGVGGFVVYPISGSPIAAGTSLTINRIVPLTQETSIRNQGAFYPQATETALDTLEFQIQQVSARTGQIRGYWASGVQYNYGDIVQDGPAGADTLNLYMCAIANTSGVWATDLAAGDWSLALNIQNFNVIGSYLPLAGGTILGNLGVNGNLTASNINITSTSASPANGMKLFDSKSPSITANGRQIGYFTTGDWDIVSPGNPVVNGFKFEGSPAVDATNGYGVTLWAIPLTGTNTNIPLNVISYGTGQLSLGSNIYPSCLAVNTHASDSEGIAVVGANSGSAPQITTQGTDTNIPLTIYAKGTGAVRLGSQTFSAGFSVFTAANAVNGLQTMSTATGNDPIFQTVGADTDIGLYINAKGAGDIKSQTVYARTDGGAANMVILSSGAIKRSTSSLRYKENIEPLNLGLDDILSAKPVSYTSKGNSSGIRHGGFIAEDFDKTNLKLFVTYDEYGRPDAIEYPHLTSAIVKGMQDMKKIIDDLTARILILETKSQG